MADQVVIAFRGVIFPYALLLFSRLAASSDRLATILTSILCVCGRSRHYRAPAFARMHGSRFCELADSSHLRTVALSLQKARRRFMQAARSFQPAPERGRTFT